MSLVECDAERTEKRLPLVTVITPVFNASLFIEDAINSVLAQTESGWEMILVDDCSDDMSVSIIQLFADQDERIKLIRHDQNSGAAVARNNGIRAASGRYIAFLDSDDVWLPHKLERQISLMQENGWPLTFSAYEKMDEFGNVLGRVGVPSKVTYSQLLKNCVIGCLTAIYDTEYFGKVDMPLIRKRQDWGLWLKLLKQTPYAYGCSEVLARYRISRHSISANKKSAAYYTWRLYREVEQLSLTSSIYNFLHYSVRGFLRHRYPVLARRIGLLD